MWWIVKKGHIIKTNILYFIEDEISNECIVTELNNMKKYINEKKSLTFYLKWMNENLKIAISLKKGN